jgi:hypothetical protein
MGYFVRLCRDCPEIDSPGLDLKGRSVPKGRLKIGRDSILDNFQPSLRDLIMFHGVPRTSVLG